MNSLLTTLLDLLRCAAFFNQRQNGIKIVHPRDILTDIFSKQLAQQQIDALADQFVACTHDQSDTLPNLEALENINVGAELEARLVGNSAALNDLYMLGLALESSGDTNTNITITNPHFFDYVQEWSLASEAGKPAITLVGTLQSAQSNVELQLNEHHQLLKRIKIAYNAHSPYPYLNLKLWSGSETSQARAERQEYQKELPTNDLNLWSRNSTIRGSIRTRLITQHYSINRDRIKVRLEPMAGLELRETSILDGQDTILVTCLRVTRPPSH